MTINSHAHPVRVRDTQTASVPIGVALPNTTGYVLDVQHTPVPISVAGELYLGGPKVARGYIGRPDLTEQSFVHVSTFPDAGNVLYKTGDCVRWLPDGNLNFLGRVDFQIKLNGQRIETGEIESVLRQVKGVNDALVVLCGGISRYNTTGPIPGPANYFNLVYRRARMEGFIVMDFAARFPSAIAQLTAYLDNGQLRHRETVLQGFEPG